MPEDKLIFGSFDNKNIFNNDNIVTISFPKKNVFYDVYNGRFNLTLQIHGDHEVIMIAPAISCIENITTNIKYQLSQTSNEVVMENISPDHRGDAGYVYTLSNYTEVEFHTNKDIEQLSPPCLIPIDKTTNPSRFFDIEIPLRMIEDVFSIKRFLIINSLSFRIKFKKLLECFLTTVYPIPQGFNITLNQIILYVPAYSFSSKNRSLTEQLLSPCNLTLHPYSTCTFSGHFTFICRSILSKLIFYNNQKPLFLFFVVFSNDEFRSRYNFATFIKYHSYTITEVSQDGNIRNIRMYKNRNLTLKHNIYSTDIYLNNTSDNSSMYKIEATIELLPAVDLSKPLQYLFVVVSNNI